MLPKLPVFNVLLIFIYSFTAQINLLFIEAVLPITVLPIIIFMRCDRLQI